MNARADSAPDRDEDDLVRLVSELWCDVLGVPEVSPSDNFFDLGGHSLLLHTVRDRLHERTGRDVPLVELFQHPTVRALAGHLGGAGVDDAPTAEGASGALGGRLARLETARGGRRAAGPGRYDSEEEAW
ncbi:MULTISPECIES: phosphopantetheine-binding protein [Streptomyces]|uniref:acyl carrier protein n=1 Tax=Streptomyces TaxID=1883 RepID=UPI0004C4ADA7|nr:MULTISPECIES: phosphopantetheine-binding protein [Streptomyces]RPK84169.1 Linear gramicidin synthase subunit B [Streptomyces sp. ADI98-10]